MRQNNNKGERQIFIKVPISSLSPFLTILASPWISNSLKAPCQQGHPLSKGNKY
jgi:hypothetical protein